MMGARGSVGNVWIIFSFLASLLNFLLYCKLLFSGNKEFFFLSFQSVAVVGSLLGVLIADAGTGCWWEWAAPSKTALGKKEPLVWKGLSQGQATVCL